MYVLSSSGCAVRYLKSFKYCCATLGLTISLKSFALEKQQDRQLA